MIRLQTLAWLFSLPIAIYLLWGAPHFVRWQVKKTLEICGKMGKSVSEPSASNASI